MATGAAHTILVQVEFTGGTWTDVTADVAGDGAGSISWRGGRSTRYDEVSAATLSVPLRNTDGRYTPGNPSSPWAGKLLRGKRIRLSVAAPDLPMVALFTGYIVSWTVTIPDGDPKAALCTVAAADLLSIADRTILHNALIEEACRRVKLASIGVTAGADVFDLGADTINCDPASTAPETTFANLGRLAAGNTKLGSLTVVRSTVAASAAAPGAVATSSAPSATDSDRNRSTTSTEPVDDLWLERLSFTPVPQAGGGSWTGPVLKYKPQGPILTLEFYVRVPDEFFIPAGDAFDRTICDIWGGNSQLLQIGLAQAAGQVRFTVRVGTNFWWLNPVADVADGQWRKITVQHWLADQVAIRVNDDAAWSTVPTAFAFGVSSEIFLGGARTSTVPGKQTRAFEGDIAGVVAFASTADSIPMSIVKGAPRPVSDLDRLQDLLGYLPPSIVDYGQAIYYSGTLDQRVARTPIDGRSLLDCIREVARTVGAVLNARGEGQIAFTRADSTWRTTVVAYLTLGDDDDLAVGDISWDDGVDQAPTRVTASWPGGQAVAEAAVVQPGSERDMEISTAATSDAQALAAARALIPDQVMLCPRRISLDMVSTSAGQWALLENLRPDVLIQIGGAPAAVLGASTWQVRVQGWDVTLTAKSCQVTLDLDSPRAVPTAPVDPGTGASGAPPTAVVIGATTTPVANLDGYRGTGELVLYTHGPTTVTETNEWGVEWLAVPASGATWTLQGPMQDRRGTGSTTGMTIPDGAIVLSGHGVTADYLATLTSGTTITLTAAGAPTSWRPDTPSTGDPSRDGVVTLVQQTAYTAGGPSSSISATYSSTPTAGNLLWAAVAMDKSAGTITAPAGWTTVFADVAPSVSLWVGYKIAAGNESTVTVTRSSSSAAPDSIWLAEYSATTGNPWQVYSSGHLVSDDSTATFWTSGIAAPPGHAGTALAFFAIDSGMNSTGAETWSSGFTELLGWGSGDGPAYVAVGSKAIDDGAGMDASVVAGHTHVGTADQISGAVVVFGRPGAVPGTGTSTPPVNPGGNTSTNRSRLPWANGVFNNQLTTAKSDEFERMAGRPLDLVDQHPAWVDITGDWWWQPHRGRGYDLMVSTPMFAPGGINTNSTSMWQQAAQMLLNAGWTRTWWRVGVEFNLNTNSWYATDANWSTWVTRFNEAASAIKSRQPGARMVLCPNEGNGGWRSLSEANQKNLVDACNWDVIAPDYYDQWEPIYNTSQGNARFGTSSTVGSMNYWMGIARARGKKFGLGEWGVASGSQWAGHQGNDNPFYMNYLLDWLWANRDVVEVISYFEEADPYLKSDIATTATNPQARAAYQAKIAAFSA